MTFKSLAIAIVSSLPLLLVACPDSATPPGTPPTPPAPPAPPAPPSLDTTAPTIVSLELVSAVRGSVKATPGVTALGVDKDANIVITFSEPMNQTAPETVFSSDEIGLRTAEVKATWNPEGTVLTLNPKRDLEYRTNVTADQYIFNLTDKAKDLAGNALAPAEFRFQTFLIKRFFVDASLDGHVRSNGTIEDQGVSFIVGQAATTTYQGFVTFNLSGLPDNLVGANIISAEMTLEQNFNLVSVGCQECGDPYVTSTPLLIDHLIYGTLDGGDFNLSAKKTFDGGFGSGELGQKSTAGRSSREQFMLESVRDDWDNRTDPERKKRAQFRLRFAKIPLSGGGFIDFASSRDLFDEPELFVQYLER
jgi:Bacterial Ig-like domain